MSSLLSRPNASARPRSSRALRAYALRSAHRRYLRSVLGSALSTMARAHLTPGPPSVAITAYLRASRKASAIREYLALTAFTR